MVTNPLTTDWVYVVKVRVLDPNMRVTNHDGELVRQQVNPVWNKDLAVAEFVMEVRQNWVMEVECFAVLCEGGKQRKDGCTPCISCAVLHKINDLVELHVVWNHI